MREGLLPADATIVMSLVTHERDARRLTLLLGEMLDPETCAVSAFEREAERDWLVEVYFNHKPDDAALTALLQLVFPDAATRPEPSFALLSEQDWVGNALHGLPAVRAGRFVVHGHHARAAVRPHEIGIEIEAALAFGTGHHGTTRGCLLHLARELRKGRPKRLLDVGTGSGVLAIAAALALHRPVSAGDIDPVATRTARANAKANGAGRLVHPVTAAGLGHPALARNGPYDVILANILARPLMKLAPALARVSTRNSRLILSGLLHADVAGVLAIYRAFGFRLSAQLRLDEWSSLTLVRGSRHGSGVT